MLFIIEVGTEERGLDVKVSELSMKVYYRRTIEFDTGCTSRSDDVRVIVKLREEDTRDKNTVVVRSMDSSSNF